MGIKAYIPFTNERRTRLFMLGLYNLAEGHDGLAEVEWPDKTKSLKPVDYDNEQNVLQAADEEDFDIKLKGRGAEPKQLGGVNIWQATAANWGAISTQAALIADREERGDGYYEGPAAMRYLFRRWVDELRDYDAGLIDAGEGSVPVGGTGEDPNADSDPEVAADGAGAMSVSQAAQGLAEVRSDPAYGQLAEAFRDAPADLTVYDLDVPDGFDAEVYDVATADEFDPNPVNRHDHDRAVEWAEQKAANQDEWWSGFLTALVTAAGLYFLFRIVPTIIAWILGAIGGGSGPNIGMMVVPYISTVMTHLPL